LPRSHGLHGVLGAAYEFDQLVVSFSVHGVIELDPPDWQRSDRVVEGLPHVSPRELRQAAKAEGHEATVEEREQVGTDQSGPAVALPMQRPGVSPPFAVATPVGRAALELGPVRRFLEVPLHRFGQRLVPVDVLVVEQELA